MRDTEPLQGREPAQPKQLEAPPTQPGKPVTPKAPVTPEALGALTRLGNRALPGRPAAKAVSRKGGAELDRERPVDIDRRSWQKLKRGDVRIDARIDLHGLTQVEAHERLNEFLMASQYRGHRCVLVITGLGSRDGGILREMTPRWLNEPINNQRIVSFTQSQLKHGGAGALYVLLKRLRPKNHRG